MKASLKLRDDRHHHHHHHDHHVNPLLRLKIPVSILHLPFISTLTTGDPKDLSFNLHSNFLTGPSLKLSYHPTSTTTQRNSISLSLKSGVGLFGSPKNSPLIISAHFNLFGDRNPTFSLQIKPQFGDFSLSKTTLSSPNSSDNNGINGNGGGGDDDDDGFAVPEGRGTVVMRNIHDHLDDDDFLSGVAVKARTVFPVKNFAAVKFRWGVNFPADSVEKMKLPFLTVDKISIERVDEEEESNRKKMICLKDEVNGKSADLEVVKGICYWMRKEVEDLQVENNAIKEKLEEMKGSSLRKNSTEGSNNVRSSRKVAAEARPSGEGSSGFENWRNKKKGLEENERRESKKFVVPESPTSDMEEELKRAIQAASSNKV